LTNADLVSTAATSVPAGMLQTAATQVVVRARAPPTPATTAVVPVTVAYRASLPLTVICTGAASVSEAGSVGRNGTWSPLRTVRDASGMLSGAVAQLRSGAAIGASPQPLPAGLVSPTLAGVTDTGGWYVTPVHFNWVPALGRMLVTGWLRRDGLPCFGDAVGAFGFAHLGRCLGDLTFAARMSVCVCVWMQNIGPGGRRRAGVSFLLDPASLDPAAGGGELSIGATRIEENAVYPSEVYRSPPALMASGSAMVRGAHVHIFALKSLLTGSLCFVSASSTRWMATRSTVPGTRRCATAASFSLAAAAMPTFRARLNASGASIMRASLIQRRGCVAHVDSAFRVSLCFLTRG
jgi:hypothetical protein